MKAAALRRIDREFEIYLQAWTNQQAKATRNNGKTPRYKTFRDFFDYEARVQEILSGESLEKEDAHAAYRRYIKQRHKAALSAVTDDSD